MKFASKLSGHEFAKDPAVVKFKDKYWMYYTIIDDARNKEPNDYYLAIGIAVSKDLNNWQEIGKISPSPDHENNGIAAPAAIVIDNVIHLFYQTYGNAANDAICHATSIDGVNFNRNATNPIWNPAGDWNNGRAIDADVVIHNDKLFLYVASRDPSGTIQLLSGASAPLNSGFVRSAWIQLCDEPILKPELDWEQKCIEAPAVLHKYDKFFMFYAGAYNNCPQQIGCAVSNDGVKWERLSQEPFLPCGKAGEWNSSESGHPYIFEDHDGRTYLFYQGNNDMGKTWYLTQTEVLWENGFPKLQTV